MWCKCPVHFEKNLEVILSVGFLSSSWDSCFEEFSVWYFIYLNHITMNDLIIKLNP